MMNHGICKDTAVYLGGFNHYKGFVIDPMNSMLFETTSQFCGWLLGVPVTDL
jgi:hypothetical protein